jgi:hypothetical protein
VRVRERCGDERARWDGLRRICAAAGDKIRGEFGLKEKFKIFSTLILCLYVSLIQNAGPT